MSTKIETMPEREFLPAAGHDLFLPLYDPIVALLGGNRARKRLIDQANLRPGQNILDIGCGTGTLSVAIQKNHPDVHIIGIDPDSKALSRAQKKAQQARVSIKFDQGFSDQLPYQDASFDRIFSTFMFHHLKQTAKEKTLQEVRRVLKPDGSFHLLDFTRLKNNSEEEILTLLRTAGFKDSNITERGSLLFLRVAYFLSYS
ncbi:class I SAM-dependent methyltransferase [bacterium]|nr:class I SAM-dependent methyltransferase [bacterium]